MNIKHYVFAKSWLLSAKMLTKLCCLQIATLTLLSLTSQAQTTIGGVNMGNLTDYLFFFANGSTDANWQGATKGFAGDVAIDGIQADERTSGGVPFAGTIFTNANTLSDWAGIVNQNSGQASGATGQTSLINSLEADLNNAFSQISALSASSGYSGVSATSLNGLNTQNSIAETFVINITSGLQVSSKINITGDAGDVFILRWDTDGNPNNGFQGQTKFQSGGAIVPLGGLKPSNFINVAGDINSSGGGSAPSSPYPQGPRLNDGTGALIANASNFSGGGFFTGYWLTTGKPSNGESSSMSNGIFVGGWYTTAKKFSMTSGTSGVYVSPPSSTSPPPGDCPIPVVTINSSQGTNNTNVCQGEAIIFVTDEPDCEEVVLSWNFGAGATPSTATGAGPHFVTYNSIGSRTVTLNADNNCDGGTGTAVCPPPPPPPLGSDCCESIGGKPQKLTVAYTGDGCSATTTSQEPGKFECDNFGGGPNGDPSVYIVVSEDEDGDGDIYFAGNVSLGSSFTADAGLAGEDKFKSNTYFLIYSSQGGALRQRVQMHTSCSAPIIPGEQIGSILLESAEWEDGSFCDISGGGSGSGSGGSDCCDDGDKPNSLTMLYTGEGCSATNTNQQSDKFDCDNFNGGPNGDQSVYIIASEDDDGGGKIYFAGNVSINSTFTATSAMANDDDFNSRTYFNIYSSQGGTRLQLVEMHTSCSAPIVAGDQIGALILESATFKNGVNCGPAIPPGADCLDCEETVTVNITVENCNPQLGSLGDFVFNDLNQNGQQDFGEPGVQGIPVQLKDCNNVILDGTVTNSNGFYQFTDLPAGCYRVGVVKPADFVFTTQNSGNDATDSDVDPVMGMTGNINLGPGENDPTNDAGIFQPTGVLGKLGDFVWFDQNGNGQQDVGEPGIPNAFVMLSTCNGNFLDFTFTDAEGKYHFNDLNAGCYKVFFANPNGSIYMSTLQNVGNDALDSDAGTDGNTANINLGQGETNLTIDAGFKPIGGTPCNLNLSVSNIVCDGKNTVTTTDDTYTFDITVTGTGTGATWQGGYDNGFLGAFAIPPTPYGATVNLGPFPAGEFTSNNTVPPITVFNGLDINVQVSDTQNGSCSASTTVQSTGPCSPPPPIFGSLGDRVFNDTNQNGVQDPGEQGVPNVTVQLKDCANNVLTTTVTNGNGIYNFPNLQAGCYRIGILLPNGFTVSPQNVGNDATDSDISAGSLMTGNITLDPGENDPTNDAGIFVPTPQTGSIGDFVWNDLNQNGQQDPGEPGVNGVTVQLKNCNNVVLTTTTTTGNGFYQFTNLQAGCYRVGVVLPSGFVFSPPNAVNDALDSDINPANAMTGNITLDPGENDPTNDAGIFQPVQVGSIGDRVFNDTNQNGVQDPGEQGVPNVTVQLKDCANNVLTTTVTNGNGIYNFPNLQAGCYRIGILLPNGFTVSPQNVGNDATDSDISAGSLMTGNITLDPGENDPTNDAGIFVPTPQTGSIGDFVWNDLNQNGQQDPGEPGVNGVTVQLKNCNNQVIAVTTTTGNGFYQFTNLQAACYRVGVVLPTGFTFTTPNSANDALDSDINSGNAMTGDINLGQGENNPTIDAGLVSPQVCDNVNFGGQIGFGATCAGTFEICNAGGAIAPVIGNCSSPSGGSGALEIIWLKNEVNCDPIGVTIEQLQNNPNSSPWQIIPGATGLTYNPGFVSTTTCYQRCARRENCVQYLGETNNLQIIVNPNCGGGGTPDCDNITVSSNNGTITIGNLGAAPFSSVKIFNSSWGTEFSCYADCGGPTVSVPVSPGTYYVYAGYVASNYAQICEKNVTLTVTSGGGGPVDNDNDGVPEGQDCNDNDPSVPTTPGTICNDGNPNTSNDVIQADGCSCAGTITGPTCNATAGSLQASQSSVTLVNGYATISAVPTQQPNVPSGFQKIYVLTKGSGLVIKATNNTPSFTVQAAGNYTIHTLVYNPATLNLGIVVPGQTTGFDVNGLLIQGGGSICAALDVAGAPVTVNPSGPTCTATAGTLSANQATVSLQGGFATITATQVQQPNVPAGFQKIFVLTKGSGLVIKATNNTPSFTVQAAGNYTIHTLVYNPATLNLGIVVPGQTTGFDVNGLLIQGGGGICAALDVNGAPVTVTAPSGGNGDCDNIIISTSPGKITVSGLDGAPVASVQVFSSNYSQQFFNCYGSCNATENISLAPGSYIVLAKYHDAGWNAYCEKRLSVTVNSYQLADDVLNFEATKHTEHAELLWLHNNGEDVETYTLERSLDGEHFEVVESYLSEGGRSAELYVGYDLEPALGDNHYRVRLDLVDGRTEYSEVKVLNFPDLVHVLLFPNPANEFVKANLEDLIGFEEVTITVFNNLGVSVKQFQLDEVQSRYFQMDIRDLREGHYIVWFDIPGRRSLAKQLMIGKK